MLSLSITVPSTRKFRRLATSGNTSAELAINEVGSTGSQYSSTPFHVRKVMLTSSSVPHDCTYVYNPTMKFVFVDSPPPVQNTTLSFLLLTFSSPAVSAVLPYSNFLDCDLPPPQCWPGIRRWWINVFFSSTLLFLMPLYFVLSCFPWIDTDSENGSPSNSLGASLDLCGVIIPSLNFSPRSPITKELFSVMIEALIVCRNVHENMVLHATPSPRARDTVTGFLVTTKGFLYVIAAVTSTPPFPCSLSFSFILH